MTLILSVTTCDGIAMAADSTVTTINRGTKSVQTTPSAANKLTVLPGLSCGVGTWGLGQINGQDTDKWFREFLDESDNTLSIEVLASRLAARLELAIPKPRDGAGQIGFLICGMDREYLDVHGGPSPVCWHVHDGPSPMMKQLYDIDVDPTLVNANNDIRPGLISEATPGRYETRNGDFQPYALASNALAMSLDQWKTMFGRQVPRSAAPSDEANFLVFKIRMISDLYQLSNGHPIIGGRVDWMTVDKFGTVDSGSLA